MVVYSTKDSEVDGQYKVPLIAKLLHTLPHYNITFHRTNNTFRPTDEIYLESLGILGSVPAALLIISLFGLLLYLLTRCCDRKPRPAHSIRCLKITLIIVTVICVLSIALGLYGNDDLHNGLLEVLQAGRKVDNLVSSVRNQTTILETTLTQKIRPQLIELNDLFEQYAIANQTASEMLLNALESVQQNVTIAANSAGDIRRPLMGIYMSNYLSKGDQWELYRWPGTVALLALLLVLCAVLLVGVARHSRCALILFSVCGLLAVTGSWLMSGLYLSTSVAVGDLCMDPAEYLTHVTPTEMPTDVLLYYTQCQPERTNPFTLRLRESQNAINNARTAMITVSKISLVVYKAAGLQPKLGAVSADLNTSERLLVQLTALVDCKTIHHNYLSATRGLCEDGLLGLVLMLIASFIAAILLTVMVWVDSHTWIYIRKRNEYAQVEEPSYISHGHPHQQQQQQQQQQHQQMQHQQMQQQGQPHPQNHQTLPRNQNGYSRTQTLPHPRKDMMPHHPHPHPHQPHPHQQQMRPMGTHTLGRLPSHNHSPSHHHHSSAVGPNNACSETHHPPLPQPPPQQQPPPHSHFHHRHPSDSQTMTIGGSATTNFQTSTMLRRPVNAPATLVKDTVEVIPSSNTVDSAMYERDQQIYKCSTMRPGNKFADGTMRKPSILNCPLPEIPKQEEEAIVAVKKPEEIYVSRFLRNPKTLPGLKAIPPPRIKSPEPKPTEQISIITNSTTLATDTKPAVSTPGTTTTPTTINPNDDSNYAVTEL